MTDILSNYTHQKDGRDKGITYKLVQVEWPLDWLKVPTASTYYIKNEFYESYCFLFFFIFCMGGIAQMLKKVGLVIKMVS